MLRVVSLFAVASLAAFSCGGGESEAEPEAPVPSEDTGAATDAASPDVDLGADADDDADAAAVDPDAGPPPPPPSIAEKTFGEPVPWAEPIADYLEAGLEHRGGPDFNRAVQDLRVYGGRLYLSYGDADHNLGQITPIDLRYFEDASDPIPVTDFTTDDEQIPRYRTLLGTDLFAAGVDAQEDGWLGNVYFRRPQVDWVKSRTLEGGVHVHDCIDWKGTLYAVGSGGTSDEWNAGLISAHLWSSTDAGETFSVAMKEPNLATGEDARWTRLLPVGDELFVFGYQTQLGFSSTAINNGLIESQGFYKFPKGHAFGAAFILETDRLSDTAGLARGPDVSSSPLRVGMWLVKPGELNRLARYDLETPVDVAPVGDTAEWLVLTYDGNEFNPSVPLAEWYVRVYVTTDFHDYAPLFGYYATERPVSVAWWKGAVHVGTGEGQVLRSTGE